ncbi:PH domain-containing protein [Streptomyces sp. WMMB 322]|uniref:PH domain-containing protein n=1 Tax=Streptomyces sp. WMMB 322 TaxID=1286821 RepID=UPI0006E42CE2|nr:PH domain-containing protein [Streptomyces sp. WMMB 322]
MDGTDRADAVNGAEPVAGEPTGTASGAESGTGTAPRTASGTASGAESGTGTAPGRDTARGEDTVPGKDTPGKDTGSAPPPSGRPSRRPEGKRLHPVTPWRRAWAPVAGLVAFSVHDFERTREWFTHLTPGWLAAAFAVLLPAAAAYGFFSWWFTSYLVTDTELRIRTGLVFRRTAHIRLDRVQAVDVGRPLLARVAGVAKLKLDVVGTEAKDELAFLGEREAVDLRAELLARAAGIAPEAAPEAGEAPARQLLRVGTRTLVTGLLLMGTGWGALLMMLAVPVLVYFASGSVLGAVAALLPALGGVWASTGGRFLKEYDWTVAESPDGLRLDHGLLDREHATVPPGRVQSVRITEPLLWRRRGWVRVELEIAGAGKDKGGVLIPVAPRSDAAAVLARVLPGVDLVAAAGTAAPVPRRARWCVPLAWRGYGHGATDAVFVTRSGLIRRRVTLVPHAKVQSVRFVQGPWERRMRLADVAVDHGANGWTAARLRDAEEARALVHAQAERSRTGRREARPDRWMTGAPRQGQEREQGQDQGQEQGQEQGPRAAAPAGEAPGGPATAPDEGSPAGSAGSSGSAEPAG